MDWKARVTIRNRISPATEKHFNQEDPQEFQISHASGQVNLPKQSYWSSFRNILFPTSFLGFFTLCSWFQQICLDILLYTDVFYTTKNPKWKQAMSAFWNKATVTRFSPSDWLPWCPSSFHFSPAKAKIPVRFVVLRPFYLPAAKFWDCPSSISCIMSQSRSIHKESHLYSSLGCAISTMSPNLIWRNTLGFTISSSSERVGKEPL